MGENSSPLARSRAGPKAISTGTGYLVVRRVRLRTSLAGAAPFPTSKETPSRRRCRPHPDYCFYSDSGSSSSGRHHPEFGSEEVSVSMRTPLFYRNRRREAPPSDCITSTRCLIRRAGGGNSLMARRSRTKVRILRRRRPQAHVPGDDRISALSDDLLLLVLRRLDTRTALGAGLLSRRWAGLPRELPALNLRVGDILPPRYRRLVLFIRNISSNGAYVQYRVGAKNEKLLPDIRRYERRAMRGLTSSVKGLLDADDGGVRARRRVSRLRLEFFATHNAGCINRLISRAIDAWGVDDLEAVAKPMYRQQTVHTFPSHGLCQDPRASRLRSLKLGGCVLPPLHEYSTLTMLVLQDVPDSPAASYEGVFTTCQQLQVLHLKSCRCEAGDMVVVLDALRSEIRELVVDHCHFRWMRLRALPSLERLASLDTKVSSSPPHSPASGNGTSPVTLVSD